MLQPESSRAWSLRAQALNELQLFADVLAAVPYMRSLGDSDTWQQEAERATTSLQSLFALLPAAMPLLLWKRRRKRTLISLVVWICSEVEAEAETTKRCRLSRN